MNNMIKDMTEEEYNILKVEVDEGSEEIRDALISLLDRKQQLRQARKEKTRLDCRIACLEALIEGYLNQMEDLLLKGGDN